MRGLKQPAKMNLETEFVVVFKSSAIRAGAAAQLPPLCKRFELLKVILTVFNETKPICLKIAKITVFMINSEYV